MSRTLLLLPLLALAGCDIFDVRPDCVHELIVTDALTGAIDIEADSRDCREPRNSPDSAEWMLLLTDDFEEPIFDPEPQRICNTPARQALTVIELEGSLAIDPGASDPLSGPGIIEAEFPENFVEGAWMQVSYWDRTLGLAQGSGASSGNWTAYFQLGDPDSVLRDEDLFGSGICD